MAVVARAAKQREQDRVLIAQMYVQGYTIKEIASAIGLSVGYMEKEIIAIREDWKKSVVSDYEERVAVELTKLDRLETQAWVGWEKSLQDAVETTDTLASPRQVKSKAKNPRQPKLLVKERNVKTRGQSGNPAYLSVVNKCIERRCQILGLDQPKKIAPVELDVDGKWTPVSKEAQFEAIKKVFEIAKMPTIYLPAPAITEQKEENHEQRA